MSDENAQPQGDPKHRPGDQFTTQGGGTAELKDGEYVWIEPPAWLKSALPGQLIPSAWRVTGPINSEAH